MIVRAGRPDAECSRFYGSGGPVRAKAVSAGCSDGGSLIDVNVVGRSVTMSEGGEARNHEAEVEAAVREALDKWLVAWTTPEHRDRIADEILAGLDAVRRSPEGEDHEALIARLRDGIEHKNQRIVALNRRIYELEHPLLASPVSGTEPDTPRGGATLWVKKCPVDWCGVRWIEGQQCPRGHTDEPIVERFYLGGTEPDTAKLMEALRFYADRSNWVVATISGVVSIAWRDHGTKAREALAESSVDAPTEPDTAKLLGKIADKAKYLAEGAWDAHGTRLVGEQIHRWASDALAGPLVDASPEPDTANLVEALREARDFIFDAWSGYEDEKPLCLDAIDVALAGFSVDAGGS